MMKKILTEGMILTVLILLVGVEDSAAGNKETLFVSANVLPKLSQTTFRQPTGLTITQQDISTGYIDIEAGTELHVTSNDPNGYFLNFYFEGPVIQATDVNVNGRTVLVQAGAGLIHQPFPGISGETVEITYRLYLSPETNPGSYPWPLTVVASLN